MNVQGLALCQSRDSVSIIQEAGTEEAGTQERPPHYGRVFLQPPKFSTPLQELMPCDGKVSPHSRGFFFFFFKFVLFREVRRQAS